MHKGSVSEINEPDTVSQEDNMLSKFATGVVRGMIPLPRQVTALRTVGSALTGGARRILTNYAIAATLPSLASPIVGNLTVLGLLNALPKSEMKSAIPMIAGKMKVD